MPVTKVKSGWSSGNLVFYEGAVGRSASGDILTIGTSTLTVGNTGQDVDLKVYMGASTDYVLYDVGNKRVDFGQDDHGVDVRFFGATSGKSIVWDESADELDVTATIEMQSDNKIQFRDTAIHIASLDDGHLDLTADTSIDLNGAVSLTDDMTVANTKAIKTDTTDGHYLDIQAYDVDGTAYATAIRVQNANAIEIGFFGATPVAQQAHVSDPSGGTTVDAEARTAINSILDILENLGLMAAY